MVIKWKGKVDRGYKTQVIDYFFAVVFVYKFILSYANETVENTGTVLF